MLLRDLRLILELFEGLPDETPVLIPGHDHSYRDAGLSVEEVVQDGRDFYAPDSDETGMKALVFS